MIKKVLTSLGICSAVVTAGFAISNVKAGVTIPDKLDDKTIEKMDYVSCKFIKATDNVKNRLNKEQYDELSDVAAGSIYVYKESSLKIELQQKMISFNGNNYSGEYVYGFAVTRSDEIDEPYDYECYENNSEVDNGCNCKLTHIDWDDKLYGTCQNIFVTYEGKNVKWDDYYKVRIDIPIAFEYSVYDAETFVNCEYGSVTFDLTFPYIDYINNQAVFTDITFGGCKASEKCCGTIALHNLLVDKEISNNFIEILDYFNKNSKYYAINSASKELGDLILQSLIPFRSITLPSVIFSIPQLGIFNKPIEIFANLNVNTFTLTAIKQVFDNLPDGLLGLAPSGINAYLKDLGISFESFGNTSNVINMLRLTNYSKYKTEFQNAINNRKNSRFIMVSLNDANDITQGIHYVFFKKENGLLEVYNNGTSLVETYKSNDFTKILSWMDKNNNIHEGKFLCGWAMK